MVGTSKKKFIHDVTRLVRKYTASMLLTVGTLAVLTIGVVPMWTETIDGRRKLRTYQDTVRALTLKDEQLGHVDAVALEEQVDVAVDAVPLTYPYQASIVMVSNLVSRERLGVTSMSFTLEQLADRTHLVIHVTVVGSYESIHRFAAATQRVLPIVSLRSVDLSRTSTALLFHDPSASYRAEIIMAIRQSGPPATIGKSSDQLPLLSDEQETLYAQLRDFEVFRSRAADVPVPFDAVDRLFMDEEIPVSADLED